MSEEITKLALIGACLADIAGTNAAIEAMRVENDNCRSKGLDDAYVPADFWRLADKMQVRAEELRKAQA